MKILGAHLQLVSNQHTLFRKKSFTYFFRTCVDKIMSTDGRTDRQTDIYPPQTSFAGGGGKNNNSGLILCRNI